MACLGVGLCPLRCGAAPAAGASLARREGARSIRDLARARTLILSHTGIMGGDPVFRRTRVPVHTIANLIAQGSTQADLLESYPRLTAEMIRLTSIYAVAHPARPEAQITMARSARRCAAAGGSLTPS